MKPDIVIIGAQKAGTSSLYQALVDHSQVVQPIRKELKYFNDELIPYGNQTLYQKHFPLVFNRLLGKRTLEGTPGYLSCPLAPQRIHAFHPGIKLVAVLRDPVERAHSAWKMFRKFETREDPFFKYVGETRSFEECVEDELRIHANTGCLPETGYLHKGMYFEQLRRFMRFFELNTSLGVYAYEELFQDANVIRDIQDFAGLRVEDLDLPSINVGHSTEEMNSDIRSKLTQLYRTPNEKLMRLLDRQLPW